MVEPQEGTQGPAANLPLNPDLMGYPTVEALVNAKRHSDQEAQRIVAERDALKNQLQYVYQAQANPRQDVKQRGSLEERLGEAGIPVEDVRELARAVAREEFQPVIRSSSARGTMMSRYPDYLQFETDVAQFIESDPELKQNFSNIFNADPVAGFEYAFLKFGDSRRRSAGPTGSESLMAEAGAHAGIPTSRNGEARRVDGNRNASSEAWDQWQRTGNQKDAIAYARTRLKTAISDDFLNE